jgi:hypothetical protein
MAPTNFPFWAAIFASIIEQKNGQVAILDLNAPDQESHEEIEKMNEQLRQLQEQSKILSERGGDDE